MGDLGNIEAGEDGVAVIKMTDSQVSMSMSSPCQCKFAGCVCTWPSRLNEYLRQFLTQLSLNGLNSIIGRGVVVHAGRDDMGRVRIYILIMIVGHGTVENNDHCWDGRVVGDVSRVKHILLLF